MGYVLKLEVGDSTAKLVLLCMANYADAEGCTAFPSVARLERDTELSERSIRSKIDWLEQHGFIKLGDQDMAAAWAKHAGRQPICYDVVLLRGATHAPQVTEGCKSGDLGVQMTTGRGARRAPNPSLTTHKQEAAPAPSEDAGRGKLVSQILAEREQPPGGRAPNFEAEFKKRFGVTPDEAYDARTQTPAK